MCICRLPKGLNEKQWLENMEGEHCAVDPDNPNSKQWGASNRAWKTGNYGVETTPQLEWHWSANMEWKGCKVADTIGGYQKEGWAFTRQENTAVRRKAVSIAQLHAEAPQLIHSMLARLAEKQGGAFADADGDCECIVVKAQIASSRAAQQSTFFKFTVRPIVQARLPKKICSLRTRSGNCTAM